MIGIECNDTHLMLAKPNIVSGFCINDKIDLLWEAFWILVKVYKLAALDSILNFTPLWVVDWVPSLGFKKAGWIYFTQW